MKIRLAILLTLVSLTVQAQETYTVTVTDGKTTVTTNVVLTAEAKELLEKRGKGAVDVIAATTATSLEASNTKAKLAGLVNRPIRPIEILQSKKLTDQEKEAFLAILHKVTAP